MLVLGIETTCDETAAAVVERQSDGSGRILSNIVRSQTSEHARFGGVVPEIAARAHVDLLDGIVAQAMKDANTGFAQLSAVAAAAGPGLIGGVVGGLRAHDIGQNPAAAVALAFHHGGRGFIAGRLDPQHQHRRVVVQFDPLRYRNSSVTG